MSKANIACLVSGGGTNLGALIKAQQDGILTSGEIKLVISNNKDAFALQRAAKANIKTAVVTKRAGMQESFEREIIKK